MPEEKNILENAKTQMRKGLLEFCILKSIATEKAYASDILQRLKKADLIVVEGTIYPLLNRLKDSGALEYSWQESKSGPPRKYYTLTKKGKDDLKLLEQAWQEINEAVTSLFKND